MITLRRSDDRGQTKLDWLDSRHTFSFGEYHDRRNMGFRDLRVINEDRVSPGKGFGTHSHRDMEIITYVLEGAVEHKDSTGTQATIVPGEVQRMSAGTGISHSEYNPSKIEPVHFLQIWILPERENLPPSYEQRAFDLEKNRGRWLLIASQDGRDGAVTVHQDVALFVARLHAGQQATYRLKPGRHAWLQIARGSATLNGATLGAGDGAAASDEELLEVKAVEDAEVLLFDLA
jgi:redox-sensitive bicupin YhaK (pirin superfamily)